VALPSARDTAATNQLTRALSSTPGIASVPPARLSPDGSTAAIVAYPTTSPQSAQTTNLVTRLRSTVLPAIEHRTGVRAYVGGATATEIDFSHVLANKLPQFIAVVIALGALLLLVVFRSLLLPVQAAVMNLLSIAASLGISQAVFERGWLASLFGVQKGPIDAFIPVMAFAIVFGLSMDYQVFLVSRIHEEWQKRHDPTAAIRDGFTHTARVITAAAGVMVFVFGAFAISGQRTLAEFGLALASAVLLDALLIRMLLLPAVLQLLGRTTWMLPRRLERRLPHIAIDAEPTTPQRPPTPALEASS
jgi:RND superfamily putative drug exporter